MHLNDLFPNLTPDNHQITSPATIKYNCVACGLECQDFQVETQLVGTGFGPSREATEVISHGCKSVENVELKLQVTK